MAMTKILFIGAGRMASAMVQGLVAGKVFPPGELACTSASGVSAENLARETGIEWGASASALLGDASVAVLAMKPQHLAGLSLEMESETEGKLVVSILAGKPLRELERRFPRARNILRVMPNTPGQIGAGISAFASLSPLTREDRTTVERILGALGEWLEVPEDHMDAVTAVSGSGPAYVFEFIAALRDAAVKAGLSRSTSARLSLSTVLGAARLVAETGDDPEVLRDRVTSPGGTTLAGLEKMEEGRFRDLMKEVVFAAKTRSEELSKEE